MKVNYLILGVLTIQLLAGCGNIYLPLEEKTSRDDLRIGVANHSESVIYIESVSIARDNNRAGKNLLGLLECSGKYNVNGPGKTSSVPLEMGLPKKEINVQWYSVKLNKMFETHLKLPDATESLISMPPWFKPESQKYPRSILYIDIKKNNNVWLRLAAGGRDINDRKDVMILSKNKGNPFEEANTHYKSSKGIEVSCEAEASKIRNISEKLGVSRSRILFDEWYPEASSKEIN